MKHTDDTAQAFISVMKNVNKQINDQTINDTIQSLKAKLIGENDQMNEESLKEEMKALFKEKNDNALKRVMEKERFTIHKAILGLRYEAVLNKQQF